MTELEERQIIANIDKLRAENIKLLEEAIQYRKRNKWFEFTLMIAVIAATIAITKLFL